MVLRPQLVLLPALGLLIGAAFPSAPTSPPGSFFSLAKYGQPASGYSPSQISAAYDFGALASKGIDGSGQTIALIEMDKFSPSDIQRFDATYGLPAPSIRQVYVGGKTFKLQGAGETTMDLEWAHALAPGARLQVYYLNGKQSSKAGWKAFSKGLGLAAKNGAGIVSISFGSCSSQPEYKTTGPQLSALLKRGISVFVSSGDDGPYPGPPTHCGDRIGVSYPGSDPSVVSVGGTSLVLNPDNTVGNEIAWDLSGGGQAPPLLRPIWQAIADLENAKYRWTPDVAFLADPHTGAAVLFKGKWRQAGGTSLGAPAWAAIWALVRQDGQKSGKVIGGAPPILYRIANSPAYSQAFYDITTGDNGFYKATAGWDPVTGWGTPKTGGLADAVLTMSSVTR